MEVHQARRHCSRCGEAATRTASRGGAAAPDESSASPQSPPLRRPANRPAADRRFRLCLTTITSPGRPSGFLCHPRTGEAEQPMRNCRHRARQGSARRSRCRGSRCSRRPQASLPHSPRPRSRRSGVPDSLPRRMSRGLTEVNTAKSTSKLPISCPENRDHPTRRSMLKRSHHETYHEMNPKHLHRHERTRGAAQHARARHAGPDGAVGESPGGRPRGCLRPPCPRVSTSRQATQSSRREWAAAAFFAWPRHTASARPHVRVQVVRLQRL